MKFRSTIIMTFLLALCMASPFLTNATAPVDTTIYDIGVAVDEGDTYIQYGGSVDMSPDSLGTYYTQAMFVANANQGTSVARAVASDVAGTEDVDITLQVSPNASDWTDISPVLYDALGTTATYDTLSTVGGTELQGSMWIRLKLVGQTGNPSTTVSYHLYLPKTTGASDRGAGMVRNRGT